MEAIAETLAPPPGGDVRTSARTWYLLAMGLLVSLPYFWLERHIVFPVTDLHASVIDRATPFVPFAAWVYLSLYIQASLPVLLSRDAVRLRPMVFGFGWIAVFSHLVFFFWPTTAPAFSVPLDNLPLRLITAADTSGNAIPSLHSSLAIYCAICAASLLKSRWMRSGLWIWTCLILTSTLLTKRHALVDIMAGAALGVFTYWALFRPRPSEELHCQAWQTTVEERKSLSRGRESELAPLFILDWRKRALEMAFFFALAALGFWLSFFGWRASHWLPLVSGILASTLALNAFVLFMHDGMHLTLFRNRAWNWLASVLLGSTFLMSFTAYRTLHNRHHRFLGDSRDPDDYQNYVGSRLVLWSLHFVRLTIGSLLYLALIPVLALKYARDEVRRRILCEYLLLAAIYNILLRFMPVASLFFMWLIPLLIVGSLTAVRGFTQHGITDATDPLLASRTVLPNPVVGFFLLHENYHLEHHLFPEVPSYHLPSLHNLVWRRLPRAVSSRSYFGFLARFFRATPRMDETPIGLEHPSKRSV